MSPLNVDRLQQWIDQGRLDPSKPITVKELVESRCIHGVKDGVKLLGRVSSLGLLPPLFSKPKDTNGLTPSLQPPKQGATSLRTAVRILVSRASASAIAAVEKAGGSITTRYYTHASIRRILRGESDAQIATPAVFPSPPASSSSSGSLSKPFAYRLPDPTSRKDIEYYRDPAHRGYLSHLVPEGEGPSLFFRTPRPEDATRKKSASARARAGKAKAENRIW